jgi:membrane associated rhomboid family serine protease
MIQTLNDSNREVRTWLVGLNVASAVISAVFGVLALVDPSANPGVSGALSRDATFYAAMYGVRAVLIAAAVCWLALADRRTGPRRLIPVLALAGVVQVGDAVIGTVAHVPGMVAGATVAAVIHLGSTALLRRTTRSSS